jgi:hypothetical protein
LPARGTCPAQQAAIERQRELARGKSRQFRRLVVAALAQARGVQGHGHDQVGQQPVALERPSTVPALPREQCAQQARVGALAVKFQGAHQRIDGKIETPGAADQIEGGRLERIARSSARQVRQAACAQIQWPREPGLLAQHAAGRGQE